MEPSPDAVRARPPRAVLTMVVVLLLEAVLMAGVGLWTVFAAFGEQGVHVVGTLFLGVLALGASAFLAAAARGMLRRAAWTRGAAIAWQVLQIGVALGTFDGAEGPVPLALALFVPAVIVLVCVFRASVTAWLRRDERAV